MTESRPQSVSTTLLQRVRNKDDSAWERLVLLFTPVVRGWCRRWGVPSNDEDDILQEVFVKVARSIDKFRRDRPGDTFRGWLRLVCRGRIADHFRKRGNTTPLADEHALAALEAPGEDPGAFTEAELALIYRQAVEQVKDEFQKSTFQAFELMAIERYSANQAAQALGMTAAAVYKAKHRVSRRLREELDDLLT